MNKTAISNKKPFRYENEPALPEARSSIFKIIEQNHQLCRFSNEAQEQRMNYLEDNPQLVALPPHQTENVP